MSWNQPRIAECNGTINIGVWFLHVLFQVWLSKSTAAVIKYCRYGVKHHPINQSINQNHRYHSYFYCLLCIFKVYTCPGIETFLWNYIVLRNYVVCEHQMQFKIQVCTGKNQLRVMNTSKKVIPMWLSIVCLLSIYIT